MYLPMPVDVATSNYVGLRSVAVLGLKDMGFLALMEYLNFVLLKDC
jgi:hypothetical protein